MIEVKNWRCVPEELNLADIVRVLRNMLLLDAAHPGAFDPSAFETGLRGNVAGR